jgi:hypothetical protein
MMIATMLRCFARKYCCSLKGEYTLNLSNSRDAVDPLYTDSAIHDGITGWEHSPLSR